MLNFENSKYVLEKMFRLKIFHQVFPFRRSFKSFKQPVFFIVDGQKRQVMYLKIIGEEKFGIAANGNVPEFSQLKIFIELQHFIKRQGGYHYKMGAAELLYIPFYQFGLMFAMLAIGTEQHDDRFLFPRQIIFGIPCGAVGKQDRKLG